MTEREHDIFAAASTEVYDFAKNNGKTVPSKEPPRAPPVPRAPLKPRLPEVDWGNRRKMQRMPRTGK